MKLSSDSKEAIMKQLLKEYTKDLKEETALYKKQWKKERRHLHKIEWETCKKTLEAFNELNRYFGVSK